MEIVEYRPDFAHHFDEINRDWIEEYFGIESIDENILTNPETEILDKGGAILFAIEEKEVLGTVALKKIDDQSVELMKMGVYKKARNKGTGKLLISAAVEKARKLGYEKVILYSARKLENAIHLYRKAGFKELSCHDNLYERCDIQMEMSL